MQLNLDSDRLLDYALSTDFMIASAFMAFACMLAAGIIMGQTVIMFSSFGFFLAGAAMAVIFIAGRQVREPSNPLPSLPRPAAVPRPQSFPAFQKQPYQVVPDVPKARPDKVDATIEV